ncbi:c-type cytochrome [Aromatoleum aromaticum]|uniref:c-type cytochrome n=1 Tax=Aromatoleum aromaticum TaxID=551760 RepID=UPI001459BD34|nr:c-type cytochrome [Aromatoleum aromaticum]NMG54419.1 c-type cytochrome [Aromatoleum aromaticum]
MRTSLSLVFVVAITLSACAEDREPDPVMPLEERTSRPPNPAGPEQPQPVPRSYPTGEKPADPHLTKGYEVYQEGCMGCHDSGAAQAPVLTNSDEWRERIDKGKETLYRHAIDGYHGNSGFCPPKGGSPGSWSDDEVRAAVDYIMFTVARAVTPAE